MLWLLVDLLPFISLATSSKTAKDAERARLSSILAELSSGIEQLHSGQPGYRDGQARAFNAASNFLCHVKVCGHKRLSRTPQIQAEVERLLPALRAGTLQPAESALLRAAARSESSCKN